MKKVKMSVAACAAGVGMLLMTSCLGSFSLTGKVLDWNKTVTNQKFVNELVFLGLSIVPVYEISIFIDALVINSIEFWTGSSPMASVDKVIKGEKGEYHVKSTPAGYDIELLSTGETAQFLFDQDNKMWSLSVGENTVPVMQFVDDENVRFFHGEKSNVVNMRNSTQFYAEN